MTYLAYFTAFGERLDAGFRTAYTFAGDWGYRDDGDMALLYIGARWYEPVVGRWTSADRWLGNIYQPLSLNRYLRGEDDPVHGVDPSGYSPLGDSLQEWGSVIAGLGIAISPLNPKAGGAAMAVSGLVAALGAGINRGEELGKRWFPLPEESPPPTEKDLKDYRRELEEGWRTGRIPKPHHPRYRTDTLIRNPEPPAWRGPYVR